VYAFEREQREARAVGGAVCGGSAWASVLCAREMVCGGEMHVVRAVLSCAKSVTKIRCWAHVVGGHDLRAGQADVVSNRQPRVRNALRTHTIKGGCAGEWKRGGTRKVELHQPAGGAAAGLQAAARRCCQAAPAELLAFLLPSNRFHTRHALLTPQNTHTGRTAHPQPPQTHLRLCLVVAQQLVAVAVHDAAYDVDGLRVQLREGRRHEAPWRGPG
jgi:hypothetical protein